MIERPDYLKRLEARRGVRCAVCDDHGCEFCPAVIERDARAVPVTELLAIERQARDNGRDRPAREREARRQELVDRLAGQPAPEWDGAA